MRGSQPCVIMVGSMTTSAEVLRWLSVSSLQSLSRVRLFMNPWTAARQASLSITNSRSLLKLMSIELVMPSNHLILYRNCLPCLLWLLGGPDDYEWQLSIIQME